MAISHGITSLGQRGLDRSRGLLKLKKIPNCTRFYLLLLYLFYAEKARAGHLVLDNFSCMQKTEKILSEPKKIAENTAWKLSRFFLIFILVPHQKIGKLRLCRNGKKLSFSFENSHFFPVLLNFFTFQNSV